MGTVPLKEMEISERRRMPVAFPENDSAAVQARTAAPVGQTIIQCCFALAASSPDSF